MDKGVSEAREEPVVTENETVEAGCVDVAVDAASDESSDEVPENLRVSRIVLISIAVLFLFTVVTVILIPPLSWSPQKGTKSQFHVVSVVEHVERGLTPSIDLSYLPLVGEGKERNVAKYAAHIEQTTSYKEGAFVRIDMVANVVISKPSKRNQDEEIDIELEDVDLHLFDGEREVPMASTDALIEGISVRAVLDLKGGMSSIIPPASKINPQIARILFTVSDAFRQAFLPLPEGEIGENASWELRDVEGKDYMRRGEVKALDVSARGARLETEFSLYKVAEPDTVVGHGKIRSLISGGVVEESVIEYNRTQELYEGGATGQTMTMSFRRVVPE